MVMPHLQKITKMLPKPKQCRISDEMLIRAINHVCMCNLRQGTILVAIHQIALSSFVLIILLVGISHVGEMLSMLHTDMEDDAESRGFYEVTFGQQLTFHAGDVTSTNNQRRFAKAQRLASVTVIFLYSSTVLTAIYLLCCISLLHGAIKSKREYLMPWIVAAAFGITVFIVVIVAADGYPSVVSFFGGHNLYHIGCFVFLLSFIYAFSTVSTFVIEIGKMRCTCNVPATNDERGERLVLLDHAAHSSLLSSAQLNKLSLDARSQFV